MARMMMNRGRMLAAMILFAASVAIPVAAVRTEGDVWYVKASNYGLDGLTGRDEEHARFSSASRSANSARMLRLIATSGEI